nr:RNA-directed DNA polymerase, eukaryota [Tanacetum cinerariifolium]
MTITLIKSWLTVDTMKSEFVVIHSSSSSAQTRKHVDRTKRKNKGKSPVESFIENRDLNAEFDECSNNSSNEVNVSGSTVPTVGHNFINSTNTFSVAGPSNLIVSLTYEKSSFIDASTLPYDLDMPDLEDFTYSDDEDVVDQNNLESSILVTPILTTRIYKDHPVSQIIGLYVKQKKDGIFINQDKYVAKILRKFALTERKSASTPIDIEKPLLKDPDGENVDVHTYMSMIGSLMYLTSPRPDIMFALHQICSHRKPHIYMLCIKQFWNTVTVKQSNDVTRLQALVNKKKVVLMKAVIRDILRLNDAEGVDCLTNEEIFVGLARMGYEKPSTKLTFYKDFFSSQWKFLIHTILQSMSAKRTSCNEFSSAMASATAAPSSKCTLGDNVAEGIAKERIQNDVDVAVAQETLDACASLTSRIERLESDKVSQALEITKLKKSVNRLEKGNKVKVSKLKRLKKVGASHRIDTSDDNVLEDVSNQGRMIDELDRDEGVALMSEKEEEKKTIEVKDIAVDDQVKGSQAKIYQIDMDHPSKVLSMQEDEPAKVKEVVKVVTTGKLITEVVTAASTPVSAASTTILDDGPQVHAATPTAVPVSGSGGFTFGFYQRFWKLIENDVVDADDKVKQAATKIGCKTLKTPFSYLGSKVGGCLDVSLRRPPRGGVELQQFEHMKEKVEGFILANIMDRWFWALEGSREFTITSVRKMIDDLMIPEVSSKTRWIKAVPIKAIEGDENSKYYHGVINKKRNHLSIHGILVEGTWIDSPSLVKSDFLSHFKNQFEQPNSNRLHMNMHFLNTHGSVQVANLECQVSKVEIKEAVWDCGIDRLTLLNSVLGSMPIYHMSLFKVSKKVLHRMESIRSYFFNGAELFSKKSVWVKWKHALASKGKGSLGLDVSLRRPPRGGVELQQFEHTKEKVEGFILARFRKNPATKNSFVTKTPDMLPQHITHSFE